MNKKIMHVVGARPNFVKAAPVINAIGNTFKQYIIHTGQHYDKKLSGDFFEALEIPDPDEHLNIGSGLHGEQTAKVIIEIEKNLYKYEPDLLIVYGDVNSTLGAAIAAAKMNVKIAHIESGLRSFDREMPEEINRILVDRISNYHFVTEQSGVDNLLLEGHSRESIFFVGNTMIDSLFKISSKIEERGEEYLLMTMHRPSNVDNKPQLEKIIDICGRVELGIIFPMHPRTEKNLHKFGLFEKLRNMKNVRTMQSAGYFEFISLMRNSMAVMTDSGGIQEETTALGVPCLTLRDNTERPVTISKGTNVLVKTVDEVLDNISLIEKKQYKKGSRPDMWDGHAGQRIATIIKEIN